ncbi:unnamed protein product [Caenorhabditis sp. 36 PRJEB53466]|nr:unnamed protein product [Caenorhabditis sp. 36 PRJEB53466]
MRLCTAKYEVYMKRFFYWLGLSIGRHPKRYIVVLLMITAISCLGFLRFHQINNARVTYTAHDSPSHREGAMFFEFLRQNGTLHMIEVLIKSEDGGNLLRRGHLRQLSEMTREITNGLSVVEENDRDGTIRRYTDMCEPYCEKNDAFYALMDIFDTNSTTFEITYPTTTILGHEMLLANNLYGVTTDPETHQIQSFKSVVLRFYLTHPTLKPMIDFEDRVVELLYESNKYPLLNAQAGSDNIVAKEVKKLGTSTAPYLGLSLVLLCAFLTICSLRYRRSESKPVEACLGAVIPVLSGVTTIGMVSATGVAFQSIIVSTLFLVLAIGIDDVFIILSAWHRSDRRLDVPHRVALTLQDAGCSMTVTTVTNLVSFGNGVLSTTPVLQTFAIYSSVASVVCYIYQLLIFPAIIALTAPKEYSGSLDDDTNGQNYYELVKSLSAWADRQWHCLAAVIGSYWMRIMTISILLGYWYLSASGIVSMETDLSIQKMANKEARIVKFKNEADEVLKEMQSVAVLVKNPADLRVPANLESLKSLIHDFEGSLHSFGSESTICWLRPYLDFLAFYEEEQESEDASTAPNFTYSDLSQFLKSSSPQYKPMLRYNALACDQNRPECLTSFVFTTGFTSVVKYNDMYPVLREWRRIAKRYPALDVYAYTERSNFVDQTNAMVANIWQTVVSEVLCMALTFIFFVPDLVSIFAAVFSLLSVNLGVFGFLSLWGVGMDPVSTASLLMSIGFSVDISAHISYHYYQVDEPTPRQKLEHAYTHIGWPTLQGGLSTMIAMVPILLCPSYLGMVFFKTVVLVSTFGLLHGLIVLPVFLSLFSDIAGQITKWRRHDSVDLSENALRSSPQTSTKNLPLRISVNSLGPQKV